MATFPSSFGALGAHGAFARAGALLGTRSLASALLLALAVMAQDPAAVGSEARITDAATTSSRHVFGDARGFRARVTGDRIECALEMAEPLVDGMFTCAELWIDCDDKRTTGFAGRELRFRAAVGSRFQPSNGVSDAGEKAIDHARLSFTHIEDDGSGGHRWVHYDAPADPPVVVGKELHFWVPLTKVLERRDRYHGRIAVQIVVETSCSDQPLERLHVAGDEGMPIQIDGRDAEWSALRVRDAADELHKVAQCVDLTGLRVDHGSDCLFVAVELAAVGFAGWIGDGDVVGGPQVTLMVEPMAPRYQAPFEVTVLGGKASSSGNVVLGTWQASSAERLLEVRLPRKTTQNRFRVIAQSDYVLRDTFETELRLDTEAR